jgi:PAS domain S-box-containing protein
VSPPLSRVRDSNAPAHVLGNRDGYGSLIVGAQADLPADATARYEALEHDLRASRDALALALAAGRMGTWSWDRESDRIVWDETLCRLFGVDEPPTTLAEWLELSAPEERARALATVEQAVSTGEGYELVHRVNRPDGSLHILEGRADVIRDAGGTVVGLRGVTLDVTEREAARRRAQRLADDAAFVAEAGVVLGATLEPDHVLMRLAEVVVPALADGCEVALLEPGGSIRRLVYAPDVSPDRLRRRAGALLHVADPHPVSEVIRTGRSLQLHVEDDTDGSRFGPADDDTSARSLGVREAVLVPLSVRGEVIGSVALAMGRSGRHVDDDMEHAAVELAARAALAFDNARLFSQQRSIAETLQQSLIPEQLPVIPWIELAGRYWVPGTGIDVGGDFYDVVVEEHGVVLVIGDVCGKGVEAAALTAMARHTIRAALAHTGGAATALRWLHDGVRAQAPQSFVTAAVGRLTHSGDGVRGEMAIGGHPRPVIVRGDGSTELIESGGSAPGLPTWRPPAVVPFTLHPGDALVLYTDGVTDVPGDAALSTAELREMLSALAGHAAEDIATGLGSQLERRRPRRQRTDDIALLVARVAR